MIDDHLGAIKRRTGCIFQIIIVFIGIFPTIVAPFQLVQIQSSYVVGAVPRCIRHQRRTTQQAFVIAREILQISRPPALLGGGFDVFVVDGGVHHRHGSMKRNKVEEKIEFVYLCVW